MPGPNGVDLNAARLLGQSFVRIEIAPGIVVELSEPDPNKINPSQTASMQLVVMLLHAVKANYSQQVSHDNALQSLIHEVAWLARRVEMLEARQIIAPPIDEHEGFVAIARQNIASASDQLREAWERQQQPEQQEQGEPS